MSTITLGKNSAITFGDGSGKTWTAPGIDSSALDRLTGAISLVSIEAAAAASAFRGLSGAFSAAGRSPFWPNGAERNRLAGRAWARQHRRRRGPA